VVAADLGQIEPGSVVHLWQLGKIDYVTGFLDEQSTQNWLKTEHCAHWLKVRGYPPITK
jgi:hypothetical protein